MDDPLKRKKRREETVGSAEGLKPFKKPKCPISKGAAKAILGISGEPDMPWLLYWIENLCRNRSLPLSFLSSEFISHIGRILEPKDALDVLERVRREYATAHPFECPKDDFSFLLEST